MVFRCISLNTIMVWRFLTLIVEAPLSTESHLPFQWIIRKIDPFFKLIKYWKIKDFDRWSDNTYYLKMVTFSNGWESGVFSKYFLMLTLFSLVWANFSSAITENSITAGFTDSSWNIGYQSQCPHKVPAFWLTKFVIKYLSVSCVKNAMLLGPANFSATHPSTIAMFRCRVGSERPRIEVSALRSNIRVSFITVS